MSSRVLTLPLLVLAAGALALSMVVFAPSNVDAPADPSPLAFDSTEVEAAAVPQAAAFSHVPISGELNLLQMQDDGTAKVAGWVTADGQEAPTEVEIWRDTTVIASLTADLVAEAPLSHPGTGFDGDVPLLDGANNLCVIATNEVGPDAVLGCDSFHYREDRFTGRIIVSDYGSGATPALGVAGEGTAQEAAARVAARAKQWADETGFETIPAFDYIQTVAQRSPGPDGNFSAHTSMEDLWEYLAAIREVGGLLIVDIQPGGSTFMSQVKVYEEILKEPDVGLALDTEWRMPWGVVPGVEIIGHVTSAEVNEVGEYLANLVEENALPQKPFVIHQFTVRMVRNRDQIQVRPELATIFHIDGHGAVDTKRGVYERLYPPEGHHAGFKLFIDEDRRLMSPSEVVNDLVHPPIMVSYQ